MKQLHVWETHEIELRARKSYENPYMEVDVWVRLKGPGFDRKVYGFWDGGDLFKVRVAAPVEGTWEWKSFCSTDDPGLAGRRGEFSAAAWGEEEKRENPCRRGMVVATPNGHGFMYADGTPVYILADTAWPLFAERFPWSDDAVRRPPGPQAGFKDVIRHRKSQGFNAVATISCFPGWQEDGLPRTICVDKKKGIFIRSGWSHTGDRTVKVAGDPVKDMRNEGGHPFLFPGKVPGYEKVFPDVERINPEYFRYVDRKIDWLNAEGFTVFIETVCRDCSTAWKAYHPWPDSYARYIFYMFARYQTANCLYSPIHFDTSALSVDGREYSAAANLVVERYGKPPFGTLCGTNPHGTTLANYGHTDEAKWLSFHQIGNFAREHDHYWYLTQIYHTQPPVPALNGEPYYPGGENGNGRGNVRIFPHIEEANLRFRSSLYGNFLSGGLAGFFYGGMGMQSGTNEPVAPFKYWDALEYESSFQLRHIREFMKAAGEEPGDLVPDCELVTPNKAGDHLGYHGWAFCARKADMGTFLLYFEKDCPPAEMRGLAYLSDYEISWFDPREGLWLGETVVLTTNDMCRLKLPPYPGDTDWGMCVHKVEG